MWNVECHKFPYRDIICKYCRKSFRRLRFVKPHLAICVANDLRKKLQEKVIDTVEGVNEAGEQNEDSEPKSSAIEENILLSLEDKTLPAKREAPISECIVVDEFKVSMERSKVLSSEYFLEYEERINNLIVMNKDGGFSCKDCGKMMRTKQHLKDHVEIHFDKEFAYNCNYCDSKFSRLRQLKSHLAPCIAKAIMKREKVTSTNESQQSVKDKAPEIIKTVEEFEIMVDQHLGRGPVGPPFEWFCTKCDFKSKSKDYVIDHIENAHLQGMAFKCEICQIVQRKHSIYKRHIKLCSKKSIINN